MAAPPAAAYETLTSLTLAEVPERDMVALVNGFQGTDVPRLAQAAPIAYQIRQVAPFWIQNFDDGRNRQIEARLVYQSDALLVWVESEKGINVEAAYAAFHHLEQEILPATRAFFGTEWQPGVDGDNRLTILHATGLGQGIVAYYASADEVVTAVHPYSNQREMLYVNMDRAKIGTDAYYSTIAHELQHLIHWHTDKNEDNWLNEGLAELAAHVNGYPPDRASDYVNQTDLPLTHLSQEPAVVGGHYAAAYLFALYFYERWGAAATQALVRHPKNGLAGVDAVLSEMGAEMTAVDLFADWLADTYLAGAGEQTPYTVPIPPLTPSTISRFPAETMTAVHQFGADYYQIKSHQPVTVIFTGTQQTRLVNTAAHSGTYVYTSLPADESDMHLTRPFDLTGLTTATLTFWTWFDIEEGWDYAYISVSPDGGHTWQLLETPSTTRENPQGNSFGPGYTGQSGNGPAPAWVQETADLTPYAGQEIWLRFHYVTDGAVRGQGFLVDDLAIPELNFWDDAESDAGWQEAGIVRATDVLPQQFLLQRIRWGANGPQVEQLSLHENQQGQWQFPMDSGQSWAILIITAVTPVTQQPAAYNIKFIR